MLSGSIVELKEVNLKQIFLGCVLFGVTGLLHYFVSSGLMKRSLSFWVMSLVLCRLGIFIILTTKYKKLVFQKEEKRLIFIKKNSFFSTNCRQLFLKYGDVKKVDLIRHLRGSSHLYSVDYSVRITTNRNMPDELLDKAKKVI